MEEISITAIYCCLADILGEIDIYRDSSLLANHPNFLDAIFERDAKVFNRSSQGMEANAEGGKARSCEEH